MILYFIMFFEFVIILSLIASLKAHKASTPDVQCFKEVAYARVAERKRILQIAYLIHREISDQPGNSRRINISKQTCLQFYSTLKGKLELF